MGYIRYLDENDKEIKMTCDDQSLEIILSSKNIKKIIEINNLHNLQKLSLSSNKIEKIEGLDNLHNLQKLYLNYNKIEKIEGLDNLHNLQILHLYNNKIEKIEGLGLGNLDNLNNLQTLYLCNNKIEKIEGLDNLHNLQQLYLYDNKIEKIEGLDNLHNLQTLYLCNNKIEKIERLDNLHNLQELYLSTNKIEKIEGLDNLHNLQQLTLFNNKIIDIPISIMNNSNLNYLNYDYEKIRLNPIIHRFLNMNKVKSNNLKVYNDSQNVHDHQINQSISKSLYQIMNDKTLVNLYDKIDISFDNLLKEILDDNILDGLCKESLFEYCKIDYVHTQLNITFKEGLLAVWNIIKNHENKNEIKIILNDEMKSSLCKCFTGRLSRLINCLNGFDNRVIIRIEDSNQIANLITIIRKKHTDVNKIREEFKKEMKERKYNNDTINEWIEYIE